MTGGVKPRFAPRARALWGPCLALAVTACAPVHHGADRPGGPTDSDGASLTIESAPARIDAVPGRTLVVPITLATQPTRDGGAAIRATLVGAGPTRSVDARLLWFGAPAAPPLAPDDPIRRWAPGQEGWSTETPPLASAPATPGFWALVLPLAPDAEASRLRVAGLDIPIRWLPVAPAPVATRAPGRYSVDAVLGVTALYAASPAERWRARLVAERFLPAAAVRFDHPLRAPMSDPSLEALATQYEDQWRAALAAVAATDPPLAARLAETLTALTEFPDGPLAPTWPVNDASLARLLSALLDPDASSAMRTDRARAWLADLPRVADWVLDDAGAPAPGGGVVASVGVVSRRPEPDLAWLSMAEAPGARPPLRVGLPPWAAAPVVLTVRSAEPLAPLTLHVGAWSERVVVIAGLVPASPPGGTITALLDDWTLASWLAAAPRPAILDRATGALLERAPAGPGWRLLVECRTPTEPPEAADGAGEARYTDHVTIYLGPTAAPAAIIRVDAPRGDAGSGAAGTPDPYSRTRAPDRWTATVPIPEGAIETDGALRIALVRIDGAGRRSAWPRPLLPWQESPGRAAFGLGSWPDITASPK